MNCVNCEKKQKKKRTVSISVDSTRDLEKLQQNQEP